MLGQLRECKSCKTIKPVTYKTFAPSTRSADGVSPNCRVCQGSKGVAEREHAKSLKPPKLVERKQDIPGFDASPNRNFEALLAEVDAYTDELMRLAGMARPPQADITRIRKALTAATRCRDDAAGGGFMTDERLAFHAFMRCLKPALADYAELGPIHEDILDALLCRDPNVVLLASRGSAKSTITAQFCAWLLWRDPEHETVLVVSRSEVHAKKLLKAIKSFIEVIPLLSELRPDDDQLDSAFQLEVAPAKGKLGMSTSVTCRGLGGQITGLRARRIIGDDIEGRRDDTPEAVDRLEEGIAEFQHVAVPGATVTLLGTPQSNFSLYGRLGRSPAWTVFRACIFESDQIDGKEVFESRWSARFTPEAIEHKKASVSKREFALHYRLNLDETSDREAPLKLAALPVLDWPSTARTAPIEIKGGGEPIHGLPRGSAEDGDQWKAVAYTSEDSGPYTQVVASVDPASGLRGGRGDAIGLAIVGVTLGGRGVVRVARGVRGETTKDAIRDTARLIAEHGVNKLLVEETSGGLFGSMLTAHLGAIGYPLSYELVTTGGVRKARRIVEAISPALASGKLFICADVLKHEDAGEFVGQFTGITYDARNLKHDDIIDALSYSVAACASALAADETEFVSASRFTADELLRMPLRRRVLNEEELEAFVGESEEEQNYQMKLERALEDQTTLINRGLDTTRMDRYVDMLRSSVAKMRAARRRIVLPTPYPAPKPSPRTQELRLRGVPFAADYD